MTDPAATSTLGRRHHASAEARTARLCFALVAVVTAIVLFAALRSPMKDDVAWLLWVARQWLKGRALYADIVEINPPLIVWISAGPVWLAEQLSLTAKQVALPAFAGFALASSWWCARLLEGTAPVFRAPPATFAVIACVLLVTPGIEFGQREHLLTIAVLPHLCLLIRVLEGQPARLRAGAGAAVLAGIGCGLKPLYIVTLGLVELAGWLRGGPRLRLAPHVAWATLLGYLLVVLWATPAFFDRAVPLALTLYGATDTPLLGLVRESWLLLLGIGVCVLIGCKTDRNAPGANVLWVLVAFMVAATLVMLADGKNWFYHRIPATVAMVLALLHWCALAYEAELRGERRARPRPWLVALVAVPLVLQTQQISARQYERLVLAIEPTLSTEVKLERLIRRERAKTYVAFSEWIGLGFPVVNNTGVNWASRFDSMWALRGELWRAREDGRPPRDWPIRRWVAEDFVTGCPDLVLVDRRGEINYVAVLTKAEPRFARVWAQYRPIATIDGLQVYKRHGADCGDKGRPQRTASGAPALR